jgi:hypothetical protein
VLFAFVIFDTPYWWMLKVNAQYINLFTDLYCSKVYIWKLISLWQVVAVEKFVNTQLGMKEIIAHFDSDSYCIKRHKAINSLQWLLHFLSLNWRMNFILY